MTTLYFRGTASALAGTFPTETKSKQVPDSQNAAAGTLKTMTLAIGSSVKNLAVATIATVEPQSSYIGAWCSPILDRTQFIGNEAQLCSVGLGQRESSLAANFSVNTVVVYVWRPITGQVVGYLTDSAGVSLGGVEPTAANATQTSYFYFTPKKVLASAGDVIICELWASFQQDTAVSRTGTFYYDGTVGVSDSNSVIASPASYIDIAGSDIYFGTPAPQVAFPAGSEGEEFTHAGKTWRYDETRLAWRKVPPYIKNPLTTEGDLVYLGADPTLGVAPKRLGIGGQGDILWVDGNGYPGWWSGVSFDNYVKGLAGEVAAAGFVGGDLTSPINWMKSTDIVRAANLGFESASGNYIAVTGTGTITALGEGREGSFRVIRFTGTGTLTHNATKLILPGNANITTAVDDCALFISEGGANWRCVSYSKKSGLATIVAAATIAGITSVASTAVPNNTVNAARLLATVTSATGDMVVQPKSTGSLLANLPDNLVAGGNKRGTQAVDWQLLRTVNDQVASGNYSGLLSGASNKATGTHAVVPGGLLNVASGNYSVATGSYANTRSLIGVRAHTVNDTAAGVSGEFQRIDLPLHCRTTGSSTPTSMTADAAAKTATNHFVAAANSVAHVDGRVTAKDATGLYAAWTFSAVLVRGATAAATELSAAVTPVSSGAAAGASGWTLTVAADTTNGSLDVQFSSPTHSATAFCSLDIVETVK